MSQPPGKPLVTVGVCTFRRPLGLQRLLHGLAGQTSDEATPLVFSILVVDNEGGAETERVCSEFTVRYPHLPLTRVVERRRGISHARNTLLDNVPPDCDFLAMIDDDELPARQWLHSLLSMQRSTGAEIVRGPVEAVYSASAPRWVVRGEYFGWPHKDKPCSDGQSMLAASTGNTLVKMDCIRRREARFDPDLALSGGEDTVFFDTLCDKGCFIVYATQAHVQEFIPPERTTLAALLRLSYRNGNNRLGKYLRLSSHRGRPLRIASFVVVQAFKSLRDVLIGALQIVFFWVPRKSGAERLYDGLLQLARGAGQLLGLFGIRYQYYR